MAISFGAAAGLSEVASATSLTTAYTVTAGSNLLVVAATGDFTTIDLGGGHDDITGITYNGVALTLASKLISNPTNSPRYLYVYFLFNPPTGVSQNVTVSCTNAHFLSATAADYKGVGVVSTPDNVATNVDTTGTATALTSSITPNAAGCWAIMATTGYANGAAPSAGTGATFRAVDDVIVSPTNNCGIFDTNSVITAGTPKSMTFTEGVANGIGAVLVTFAPPTVPPKKRKKLNPTQRKTLKPRRRRIAAYIGGTANLFLNPPKQAWNWNKQAPPLSLALGTISKSWSWTKNTPSLSLTLGAVSKSWAWAKNAPPLSLALGTVSKSWAWTKNAVTLGQVIGTISKSWTWAKNAPVLTLNAGLLLISKQWQWTRHAAVMNIKVLTNGANVVRGVVRGIMRGVVGR